MADWRPIETIPKEGRVLIWCPYRVPSPAAEIWECGEWSAWRLLGATHWTPLPEAPEEDAS